MLDTLNSESKNIILLLGGKLPNGFIKEYGWKVILAKMIQFDAPDPKDLSGVMTMLKNELHNIESFPDSMMIKLLLLRFDQFDIANLFRETKTIFEVKPEID